MSRYWIIADDAGLQTLRRYYEMFLLVQSAFSVKYATQKQQNDERKEMTANFSLAEGEGWGGGNIAQTCFKKESKQSFTNTINIHTGSNK